MLITDSVKFVKFRLLKKQKHFCVEIDRMRIVSGVSYQDGARHQSIRGDKLILKQT